MKGYYKIQNLHDITLPMPWIQSKPVSHSNKKYYPRDANPKMTHMLAFYSRNLNWVMHILNKIKINSKKVENFSGKEK